MQKKRDTAVNAKRKIREEAQDEIKKFYAEQADRLAKQQKANRVEEKTWRTEMKQVQENGTRWEKVAKFTNLATKANDKQGIKTERIRKLVVALKSAKQDE